jgi:hypothetical protein
MVCWSRFPELENCLIKQVTRNPLIQDDRLRNLRETIATPPSSKREREDGSGTDATVPINPKLEGLLELLDIRPWSLVVCAP